MSVHYDVNLSFEDYNVIYDALLELQAHYVNQLTDASKPYGAIVEELTRIQIVRSKLEAKFQH